jgi:hypothetical protein
MLFPAPILETIIKRKKMSAIQRVARLTLRSSSCNALQNTLRGGGGAPTIAAPFVQQPALVLKQGEVVIHNDFVLHLFTLI